MKKLVRVSLFVLMALTLSLAIGCKHDSDPEPAKEGSRTPFVGTWVDESGDITCMIDADGTFVTHVTQAGEKYEGKYHVSPDGKTVTATITEVTFTLTSKSEDTLELTLPENLGGKKVTLTKKVDADSDPEQKPASANFVGKWLMDNLMAHIEIKPDGTLSASFPDPSGQSEEEMTVNGTYTLSEDGKTATSSAFKIDGLGEDLVVIMKMENTDSDVFTVNLSALGMGVVPYVRKSTSLYPLEGVWKNEDGSVMATVRADKTVSMSSSLGDIEGTYTQDGNTFTVTGNNGQGEILTAIVSVASGRGYASYWSGGVDYISDVFTKQ